MRVTKSPEFESTSEPVLRASSKQGMEALTHHGRAGCLPRWSKVRIWMARLINDGSKKLMMSVTINSTPKLSRNNYHDKGLTIPYHTF
jgi:hypothetical protein